MQIVPQKISVITENVKKESLEFVEVAECIDEAHKELLVYNERVQNTASISAKNYMINILDSLEESMVFANKDLVSRFEIVDNFADGMVKVNEIARNAASKERGNGNE